MHSHVFVYMYMSRVIHIHLYFNPYLLYVYTQLTQKYTQCMQTLPLKDVDFYNEHSLYAAFT